MPTKKQTPKHPKYITALRREVAKLPAHDATSHVLRSLSCWKGIVFSHADGTYCHPRRAARDARGQARVRYWNNLIERIYGEFDLPVGVWWDAAARGLAHAKPTKPAVRSVVRINSKKPGIDYLIDALLERKTVSSEGGVKLDSVEFSYDGGLPLVFEESDVPLVSE